MIEQPQEISSAAATGPEAAHAGLIPQSAMMIRALLSSPVRAKVLLLSAAIFVVIAATAYGQIRLNSWNQPFYDALSHRDFRGFLHQLGIFGLIAGALLALNVAQTWLGETLKVRLREGLIQDLIRQWLKPGRAFRLASAGQIGVNPDQRLHEDARHLTELSAGLAIGLLQASILLATFVEVLWALSSDFRFALGGRSLSIPGYMVWAAVIYACSASLLSYWVGRSLIDRNAERYAREADLRFSLMRVSEHVDAIALAAGEADEARRLELDLAAVLAAMRRLVTGATNLTWVTAGYGWFTLVAPILAAAPMYFAGTLSFGGLMMAAGAFNQVQSSLRWFVDNFSTIADWRATLLRVASFRRAVIDAEELHTVETRITIAEGAPGRLGIEGLEIASPAGCIMLEERHVEIKARERVLIIGEPGTGKTLLFRALAGLWPWGEGRIERPRGEQLLYVPRTPYLPPGTLREALAYPAKVEAFSVKACEDALLRLGLRRLAPMLEVSRRWDRELSEDEQQGVALARMLLHAPRWVLIDEMLDSIDHDTLRRVLDAVAHELKDSTVIHIGRSAAMHSVFQRVLHLVKDPTVRRLARGKPAKPPGLARVAAAK
jgi:putative ATP-binding cassette transporter